MKKIASFILVLVIIVEAYMIFPITGVSASEVNNRIDFPTYQAEIIDKGYDGNDGYYDLLKSMKQPLYYDFTEYMLDDEVLCWTSNFWNSAFNQDFKSNPSYFYEVILMGFLKFDQHQIDTSGVWNSSEMSLSVGIYNKLIDKYVDVLENPTTEKYYNYIKNLSVGEVENAVSQIDDLKLSKDAIKYASKGAKYVTDFVKRLSDYQNLLEAKEQRIEMLKLAKENVKDNEYFTKAVDDIINFMNKTEIEYVSDKTAPKMWCDFIDNLWKSIVKSSPIGIVLEAIDIENIALDVLFNSSDTAYNNFKLLVLYIVDTYFSSSLKSSYENYKKTGSFGDSCTLVQCYRSYIEYQIYGLDYTKTFIDDIVDNGGIHSIVEQIFFKDNVKNASELKEFCNNQANNRKRLLELLDKAVNSYYHTSGFDELVEVISSSDKPENVSVTGISFSENESTINGTEDICLVYANVYPENATNKKVTYTSSDPSILSVPTSGGFATPNRKGSVIVTATTEDGNFIATQKINVNFNPLVKVIDHGKCGSKAYWKMYSDGTFYVTGAGDMSDNKEWEKYKDTITNLIVSNGITAIRQPRNGSHLTPFFEDCNNLVNVSIADSVTYIDYGTFMSCNNLKKVKLSNNLTAISSKLFAYCYNLEDVIIPDSVKTLEEFSFGCTNITKIDIPGSISKIEDYAFEKCPNLNEVNIENGVTVIGKKAFFECPNLVNVYLPSSLNTIDDYAFYNCKSLNSVTIPNCVTTIGSKAFYECSSIKELCLSEVLSSIGDEAFYKCKSLESVTIPNSITKWGKSTFAYCTNLKSVNFNEGLKSIGINAFEYSNLTSVVIPNSVEIIESDAFSCCHNLYNVKLPMGLVKINNDTFSYCQNLHSINIPYTVNYIGNRAFESCKNLSDLVIPKGVKYIGDEAFYDCRKLSDIVIPSEIENIGSKSFYNCDAISNLVISGTSSSNTIEIGENAFEYSSIKNVKITRQNCKFAQKAFVYCYDLKDIRINGKNIEIGDYALCYNSSLKNVNIVGDNINFGEYIFYRCESLTNITIPEGVTSINRGLFAYCNNLTSVKMPNSIVKIYSDAFLNCNSINNIFISKYIENIDSSAFIHCFSLDNILVDEDNQYFKSIDGSLYSKDETKLIHYSIVDDKNTYVIPNNVVEIGDNAFYDCDDIDFIYIPTGVTKIGNNAFYDCNHLNQIFIPHTVTTIKNDAFDNCYIDYIYFYGTEDQWKNTSIGTGNSVLTDYATVQFSGIKSNESSFFGTEGKCKWSFDVDTSTLSIENSYTKIGDVVWAVFLPITKKIIFTSNSTEINIEDIKYCSNLDSITIPSSVEGIDNLSLMNNIKVKDIYYGGSKGQWHLIDKYGENANDINIHFGSTITYGKYYNCQWSYDESTEVLTISKSNETGKYYNEIPWLYYASNIKKVIVQDGVDSICESAFSECTNLESVHLPTSVTIIDSDAFSNCSGLKNVYYKGSRKKLESITYSGNEPLLNANIQYDTEYISGTTGDCIWTFNEKNGILSIFGDGNMEIDDNHSWLEHSSKIKKVSVQDGIETICDSAFKNCTNLESITIPSSVINIGEYAFQGCSSLNNVYYEGTKSQIRSITRKGNESLLNANIHCSTTTISGTTGDCTWIFDESNYSLTILGNGNMSDYNDPDADYYERAPWLPYSKLIKNIVIKSGVKNIGVSCFSDCTRIDNIEIPSSVTKIGSSAFSNCPSLKSITIPTSVVDIGDSAFYDCDNLSRVYYMGTKEQWLKIIIDDYNNCLLNADIYFNSGKDDNILNGSTGDCEWLLNKINGIITISGDGSMGYYENSSETPWYKYSSYIKEVNVKPGVEEIDDYSFDGCKNLSKVSISDSVSYIGSKAFSNCPSLTSIVVDENNITYSSFEGNLFNKDKTEFILYSAGKSSDSFIIPNSVTRIGWYAFENANHLKSISLPSDLRVIFGCAFKNCSNISTITIPINTVDIGWKAFDSCKELKYVYYNGTKKQWESININSGNDCLLNADIHFLGEIPETSTNITTVPSKDEPTASSTIPTISKPKVNKVTSVVLNKKFVTLLNGRSINVNAKITPSNATNKKLKWTTSNSKVAVVNSQGKITAKGKGVATIKATALDGSKKYATCKVTVKQPVTSVKLNKKSVTLKVKGNAKQKTVTLTATVSPSNAYVKTVTWKSSNSKVATVNSKGKVTAKKRGACYIIATAKDGSKKYAKCKIIVR